MNINNIINKALGVIRFQAHTMFRTGKIHSTGVRNYLGKGAKLKTSEKGIISLGNKTYISDRTSIGSHMDGSIVIGNNNFFNSNVSIVCLDSIVIGDNNLFAQNVVIVDHGHKYENRKIPICEQGYATSRVIIGSDCWICANVVICQGSTIGNHIVISANSVVKGNLDISGVYAGNPAKLVKGL